MAMTPEGKVKAQIDKLLKAHDVWYFKPVQTGLGVRGTPDYLCLLQGRFFAIEAKADATKKPTEMQKCQMEEIMRRSGYAMVIHAGNLDELRRFLASFTGDSKWR